jgi:hypothetical protein
VVYEVPTSKASIKQNRFEFKVPGDKKLYSLPLLKYLKPSLVLTVEDDAPVRAMSVILEEYAPGVYAKFEDGEQVEALFNAYAEASGVDLGESSASVDS